MIKIDSSLHTIPNNSSNRGMEAGAAYPEEDSGLIPVAVIDRQVVAGTNAKQMLKEL